MTRLLTCPIRVVLLSLGVGWFLLSAPVFAQSEEIFTGVRKAVPEVPGIEKGYPEKTVQVPSGAIGGYETPLTRAGQPAADDFPLRGMRLDLGGPLKAKAEDEKGILELTRSLVRTYLGSNRFKIDLKNFRVIPGLRFNVLFSGRKPELPGSSEGGLVVADCDNRRFFLEFGHSAIRVARVLTLLPGGQVAESETQNYGGTDGEVWENGRRVTFDAQGRVTQSREYKTVLFGNGDTSETSRHEQQYEYGPAGLLSNKSRVRWERDFEGETIARGSADGRRHFFYDGQGRRVREESRYGNDSDVSPFTYKHTHDFKYDAAGRLIGENTLSEGRYRGDPYRLESVRLIEVNASEPKTSDRTSWTKRFGQNETAYEEVRTSGPEGKKTRLLHELSGVRTGNDFDKTGEKWIEQTADGRLIGESRTVYENGRRAVDETTRLVYGVAGRALSLEAVARRYQQDRKEMSEVRRRLSFDESGRLVKSRVREFTADGGGGMRMAETKTTIYSYENDRLSYASEKITDENDQLIRETSQSYDIRYAPAPLTAAEILRSRPFPDSLEIRASQPDKGIRSLRVTDYAAEIEGEGQNLRRKVLVSETARGEDGKPEGTTETVAWYASDGELSYIERNRYAIVPSDDAERFLLAKGEPGTRRPPGQAAGDSEFEGTGRRLVERDDLIYDTAGEPNFHVHQENAYDQHGVLTRVHVAANDGYRLVTYEDEYSSDFLGQALAVERTARGDGKNVLFKDFRKARYNNLSQLENLSVRIDGPAEAFDADFQFVRDEGRSESYVLIEGKRKGPDGERTIKVALDADYAPYWLYSTEEMVDFIEALSQLAGDPVR